MSPVRAALWATPAYFSALAVLLVVRFDTPALAWASLDFNASLFEDLLGPYWRTAQSIAIGAPKPDPQYVYPAFLAIFLAPLTVHSDIVASWVAVHFGIVSIYGLFYAAFAAVSPRSTHRAVVVGAVAALAYPLAHGLYWANAGLWSIALAAAGWMLAVRASPIAGGALIGTACALKVSPLVLLFGLVIRRDARAILATLSSFALLAIILPLVVLGPHGAVTFHSTSFANLRTLAETAATSEGGRGSSSLISLAARSLPSVTPWLGYGLSTAALFALLMSAESRIKANPRSAVALVLLLALPTLLVTPSWVHGAGWLLLAWWLVVGETGPVHGHSITTWALTAASFALASLPATWAAGGPEAYQSSGALTASVLVAVVAVWMNERTERRTPE